MNEIITCPACQRQVQLPAEFIGRTVQCPECRHVFVAGGSAGAASAQDPEPTDRGRYADDEDDAFDDWDQRRRLAGPRADRSGMILAFGILTVMAPCFLGLIFGPLAWFMGTADLAAIDQGDLKATNRGLIQAGRIIGAVGFCFQVFSFLAAIAYFAFVFAMVRH